MPSVQKKAVNKTSQLKAKAKAVQMKAHQQIKLRVQKHIKQGKSKLSWLESQIRVIANQKKLNDQFEQKLEKSKEKLTQAKEKFYEYEKKANAYIKENPKKALAIAGAAAYLAGAATSAFRKK